MVNFFRKKDPFDPAGLEGLTRAKQEEVLARVAVREQELLEDKKEPTVEPIGPVVEERIKRLEKQKGFSRLRQRLIDEAVARERQKEIEAKAPIKQRLRQLAPTVTKRGLSPFQRKILQRERVLKFLKQTPPMDRARALNKSSEFQRARDAIRGVDSLKAAKTGGGIVKDTPAQLAQQRLRDGMNAANQTRDIGEKTGLAPGGLRIKSSRLKAPPSLL